MPRRTVPPVTPISKRPTRALPNYVAFVVFAIVAFEYDLQTVCTPFPCLRVVIRLKLATGPYKAARDAYVAATATYTKSLYE